ncbi:FMN-binding protein [bacterium]|nr:FMN-binding protein [bacterium]
MKFDVNSPRYVIGFTALIACTFTAAVMTVHVATADKVRRNEALRRQKALVRVFGLGDVEALSDGEIAALVADRINDDLILRDPETDAHFQLFQAYAGGKHSDATRIGYAFEVSGIGLWAPVRGLMAVTVDLSEALGIVFVEHKETPGLGGRIAEDDFQEQFRGLTLSPPPAGQRTLYIGAVERDAASPRYGRCVDAISGATQTCRAVEGFLNRNIEQFRRAMANRY